MVTASYLLGAIFYCPSQGRVLHTGAQNISDKKTLAISTQTKFRLSGLPAEALHSYNKTLSEHMYYHHLLSAQTTRANHVEVAEPIYENKKRMSKSRWTLILTTTVLMFLGGLSFRRNSKATKFTSPMTIARVENTTTLDDTLVNKSKPIFYFHIGLQKTGTTFLQSALSEQHSLTRPILLQDELVYLGTTEGNQSQLLKFGGKTVVGCCVRLNGVTLVDLASKGTIPESKHNANYPLHPHFQRRVKELISTGQDVLFIYEVASFFSDKMIQKIKIILEPHFHVKVLVAHRYFHDWLLSWHNQDSKLKTWMSANFSAHVVSVLDLQNPKTLSTQLFTALEQQKSPMHPAIAVQRHWQKHFHDVEIIPLGELRNHQAPYSKGDPLMEFLFCHIIRASHTCAHVRNGIFDTLSKNPSRDLGYDLIAQEAYHQGLIPRDSDRFEVARRIQQEVEHVRRQTVADFPQTCLTNEKLIRLDRLSIALDSAAVSWTDAIQREHRDSFDKAVSTGKFCVVDAKAVLMDDKWRSFLQNI